MAFHSDSDSDSLFTKFYNREYGPYITIWGEVWCLLVCAMQSFTCTYYQQFNYHSMHMQRECECSAVELMSFQCHKKETVCQYCSWWMKMSDMYIVRMRYVQHSLQVREQRCTTLILLFSYDRNSWKKHIFFFKEQRCKDKKKEKKKEERKSLNLHYLTCIYIHFVLWFLLSYYYNPSIHPSNILICFSFFS